jgi:hypothetical protein
MYPSSSKKPKHMLKIIQRRESFLGDVDENSGDVYFGLANTDPTISTAFYALLFKKPAKLTLIAKDYSEYMSLGKGLSSNARVGKDGRIAMSLNLGKKLPDLTENHALDIEEFAIDSTRWKDVPRLNIIIMIVGSRGG